MKFILVARFFSKLKKIIAAIPCNASTFQLLLKTEDTI